MNIYQNETPLRDSRGNHYPNTNSKNDNLEDQLQLLIQDGDKDKIDAIITRMGIGKRLMTERAGCNTPSQGGKSKVQYPGKQENESTNNLRRVVMYQNDCNEQTALQAISQNYKTQMCKYEGKKTPCKKGKSCHFAHNESELRDQDDPLPSQLMEYMLGSTYKQKDRDIIFKIQSAQVGTFEPGYPQTTNSTASQGQSESPHVSDQRIKVNHQYLDEMRSQKQKLKIVLIKNDNYTLQKMLQANRYLQAGFQDQSHTIIKDLLNQEAIFIQFQTDNHNDHHYVPEFLQNADKELETQLIDDLGLDK